MNRTLEASPDASRIKVKASRIKLKMEPAYNPNGQAPKVTNSNRLVLSVQPMSQSQLVKFTDGVLFEVAQTRPCLDTANSEGRIMPNGVLEIRSRTLRTANMCK